MQTKNYVKSIATKKSLCEAAMKLINKKGYKNVKIKDITDTAAVAKGVFYYYFKSKEDVLLYSYVIADEIYTKHYNTSKNIPDFKASLLNFIELAYKEIEKFGREIIKSTIHISLNSNKSPFNNKRMFINYLRNLYFQFYPKKEMYHFDEFADILLATLIGSEYVWSISQNNENLSDIVIRNVKLFLTGYIKNIQNS